MRAIAYRMQEEAYGGLKPVTRRRLQRLAADLHAGKKSVETPRSMDLKPGTRLLREWQGETHIVDVLTKGFGWQGEVFASLSAVAVAITGTQRSGPRFFGLLDKKKRDPVDPSLMLKAFGS